MNEQLTSSVTQEICIQKHPRIQFKILYQNI